MKLTALRLHNFRGYGDLSLTFESGLHVIQGDNGSGKTNLAEAIHYLSLARSWRTSDEKALIKDGEEEAFIDARIEEGNLHRGVQIALGRNSKRVSINGKPIRRLSELSAAANVIVFSPMDVPLFAGSPGERRSFLDVALSKMSNDYLSLVSAYSKLLKERNAALKARTIDQGLLDVLSGQMVQVAEPLVRYRRMYVTSLNAILPKILTRLRGEESECALVYHPFVKDDERFLERAKRAYEQANESDLIHRSTSVGPHREDLTLLFNGKDISDHGSQGENRIAVLALKLAPYFLIEEEAKKPIVVLDDVASELDDKRVENLIEVVKDFNQVFLTATKLDIEGAVIIDVANNNATRRN